MKTTSCKLSLLSIVALFLALPLIAFGKTTFAIKGKISAGEHSFTKAIPVVLSRLELKTGEEPSVTPIMKSQTDREGNFFFGNLPSNHDIYYKVSATLNNQTLISRPVKFEKGNKVLEIALKVPEMKEGLSQLIIAKNLVVFEALEGGINVTDILIINNPTNQILDGKNSPIFRKLPKEAKDFRIYPNNREYFEIDQYEDKARLRLKVPPGTHQLIYSYNLFAFGSSIDFDYFPAERAQMLEIIFPSNNPLNMVLPGRMIPMEEKFFGRQKFNSTIISSNELQSTIPIIIENLPVSQTIFVIPALILLLLLLIGLSVYTVHFSSTLAKSQ